MLSVICRTPANCPTHLGVISFHFTELSSIVRIAVNISELYLQVCSCNVQPGSDSKLQSTLLFLLFLMRFSDILYWGYTQPINAMPKRVIVLLNAYKYIKRCLPLIYSINCLEQIYSTLYYMWGNRSQDSDMTWLPGGLSFLIWKIFLMLEQKTFSTFFGHCWKYTVSHALRDHKTSWDEQYLYNQEMSNSC